MLRDLTFIFLYYLFITAFIFVQLIQTHWSQESQAELAHSYTAISLALCYRGTTNPSRPTNNLIFGRKNGIVSEWFDTCTPADSRAKHSFYQNTHPIPILYSNNQLQSVNCNEPMNEWTNEWMNEPMNEWTNEWIN
jgi:hypothetical protein